MSKFDWNRFDAEFISSVVYSPNTKLEKKPSRITDEKEMLITNMEKIAASPDRQFVINYRNEIEFILLKKHPEYVEALYKSQTGMKGSNYLSMLNELSGRKMGNMLANAYISVLYAIGSDTPFEEVVSDFVSPVKLALTTANEVPLYDFQKTAVEKLKKSLIEEDMASGLLVMPTGSGKTRTATYFLLKNMISAGYQAVWLTHRHMLIDQTADAFCKHSTLIKLLNPEVKSFKMACISGEHSTIKATEKDDNVMVISVQSVCRSLDYLKKALSKKVIIVVDEAHHSVAMSYRKTIDYIRKIRKDAKLLGLTATPIRGTDSESRYLTRLFDNNFIYDISMSELISKGILAKPNFERVETNTDFEAVISLDEARSIKKFGELPPTLIDKIANSSKRNKAIVETYMENRKNYGKTLIFALNVHHCITLCEDLRAKGVKCDFVYSGNPDNGEKIRRFKENELEVLININILTEGSDVPDIQTVFLTRPMQSDVLLMQMIGRGMRGKLAGGTDTVNIVDFCDKWDTFNKWLNPKWIIEAEELSVEEESVMVPRKSGDLISIPFDLIKEIYQGISFGKGDLQLLKTMALPAGWYCLLDEEGDDYRMFVWEEQLGGFDQMTKKVDIHNVEVNEKSAKNLVREYFGGFEVSPRVEEMEIFIRNWKESGDAPYFFSFENRDKIDPVLLAQRYKEENVGIMDLEEKSKAVYEMNTEMIHSIYGNFDSYYERIVDCLKYKDGIKPVRKNYEEVPIDLLPYRIEPTHDLQELTQEVIQEMFQGKYEGLNSIVWTTKPMLSYYGIYYQGGDIKINKLLDSPDVDREIVKYVIYHELLHKDYWRHDKEFYTKEHLYPDYTEHNRFLDFKIADYKFEW